MLLQMPFSRNPDALNVFSISLSTPTWLEKLQQEYEDDEEAKLLLTQLAVSQENDKGFSLVNVIIRHKGRLWVGNNVLAQ